MHQASFDALRGRFDPPFTRETPVYCLGGEIPKIPNSLIKYKSFTETEKLEKIISYSDE